MNGIKTKSLDAVKTRIMSDVSLKSNFDGCVTLFKEFIRSNDYQEGSTQCNISAMSGSPGESVNLGNDRFVPPVEWNKMTHDQKEKHKQAHAACRAIQKKQKGNGGGAGIGTSGGGGARKRCKSDILKLVTKIVNCKIAALKTGNDDGDNYGETFEKMNDDDAHPMCQKSAKIKKARAK